MDVISFTSYVPNFLFSRRTIIIGYFSSFFSSNKNTSESSNSLLCIANNVLWSKVALLTIVSPLILCFDFNFLKVDVFIVIGKSSTFA